MNKKYTRLKPLSLSVFFAMAAMGAHAAQASPFAAAPNYLTETASTKETIVTQSFASTTTEKRSTSSTSTTFGSVKPNIMLYIDDSTSMDTVERDSNNVYLGTRTDILSNALKKVLSPDHKDKDGKPTNYLYRANWGITPMNMIGKDSSNTPYPLRMPSFGYSAAEYERNSQKNTEIIKKRFIDEPMWRVALNLRQAMASSTPFITRYIDAVAALDEGIHYRCQKNYLIALTDGAANFESKPNEDNRNLTTFFWPNTGRVQISWNFLNGDGYANDMTSKNLLIYQMYFGKTDYGFAPYFSMVRTNYRLNSDNAQVDTIGNLNLRKTWHKVFEVYRDNPEYNNHEDYRNQLSSPSQTPIAKFCHSDFYNIRYAIVLHTQSAYATNCQALQYMYPVIYYPYTGIVDHGLHDTFSSMYFYNGTFANAGWQSNVKPLNDLEYGKYKFKGSEYAFYISQYPNKPDQTVVRWPALFERAYVDTYAPNMMKYLSEPLSKADLRTEGVDKTGKPWDGKQNIQTFNIAFGSEVRKNHNVLQFLREGASKKAGTQEPAYWEATSEQELSNAFEEIFKQIAQENPEPNSTIVSDVGTPQMIDPGSPSPDQATSAQSISEVPTYTTAAPSAMGSSIANMAATVYLPAGLKSSELRFYSLNDQAQADTSKWRVPDFSTRKLLINYGTGISWLYNTPLDNNFFNLSGRKLNGSTGSNEWKEALLSWILRKSPDTTIANLGYETSYRIRPTPPTESPRDATSNIDEYNMGDILDTPVQALGANGVAQGNRQEFLVTAANDGMVYLFQSNPDPNAKHPYALKLNYLPSYMPRDSSEIHAHVYQDLAHKDYTKTKDRPHLYMINGGITTRTTTKKNNAQQLLMLGTLGQGGRGMYALTIGGKDLQTGKATGLHAKESNWISTVPLFEVRANIDPQHVYLGYTVSYPQIGRVAAEHDTTGKPKNGTAEGIYYASFLASGFSYPNPVSQKTELYIHDLLGVDVGGSVTEAAKPNGNAKGKLLAKIAVPGSKGGLASPTLLDVNQDGIYDFAFAGDYAGDMYRFDLRKINLKTGTQTGTVVKKIYDGDPSQPITTAPAISYEKDGRYVIMFGTGSDIYEADFYNTNEQAIYGIYQRFDPDTRNPVDINSPTKMENNFNTPNASSLLTQVLSTVQENGNTMRNLTDYSIKTPDDSLTHPGWKIRLGTSQGVQDGERVVVQPYTVLGTLVISSRIYNHISSNQDPNWDAPWSEATKDTWQKVDERDTNHTTHAWSPWERVANESTSSSSGGADVCDPKVTSNTNIEKRTQRKTFDHVITYRKTRNIHPQTSGWTLAIKAENGGAISLKTGTGIDFLKQYDSLESAKSSTKNGGYFFAGSYNASSSNSTFITGSTSIFSKAGTSMNSSGASLNTGEDFQLNESGNEAKDCLDSDQNFIIGSTTGAGLGDTYRVWGKICATTGFTIRRLSWREIF